MSGRILVFVPAYRCADQIGRVIAQLDPVVTALIDGVVVIDNRSPDDTVARAIESLQGVRGVSWAVLRNDDNYGLGGSHKVAVEYADRHGYEWLLVLHGDDQADVHDFVGLLRSGGHLSVDAVLGSRFMRGARRAGYSKVRTAGNHAYNLLFSLATRRRLHDLGSGLNLFRVARLADPVHLRFADDLTFNYHLIMFMAAERWRLRFVPISWREEDQRSNVKLAEQGMRTLGLVGAFVRDRAGFLAADHSGGGAYTAEVVAQGHGDG